MNIVRFFSTASGKPEMVTSITLDNDVLTIEGKATYADALFGNTDREDYAAVLALMQAAPMRFDGGYLRAEYVGDTERVGAKGFFFKDENGRTIFAGGPGSGGGGSSTFNPQTANRAEMEQRGYIAVFRGTGEAGIREVRPSSEGELGPGIYFYDDPTQARTYAEPGGGIVTGFVHPDSVSITNIPGGSYSSPHRVIVAKDVADFIRRGDIPTELTSFSSWKPQELASWEQTVESALNNAMNQKQLDYDEKQEHTGAIIALKPSTYISDEIAVDGGLLPTELSSKENEGEAQAEPASLSHTELSSKEDVDSAMETAIASETVLAKDWEGDEEDALLPTEQDTKAATPDLATLAAAIVERSTGKATAEDVQRDLLEPWLTTVFGTPASNQMQKVAARTFGFPDPPGMEELQINWQLLYPMGEMYNITQEYLAARGFKEWETVPVYRPYVPTEARPKQWQKGDEVRIKLLPLTSWTLDISEAVKVAEFLGAPGSPAFVLKTFIPIKSVVSTPNTGIGIPGTSEVVLAGGEYEAIAEQRYE